MNRIILALFTFLIISGVSLAQEKKDANSKPAKIEIYNPKADAKAELKAAATKAKKEGKHVFVQVGGNWCGWCILFHKLVDATPELKNYLNNNYETVLVNYSPENKNADVMASLGYPGRFGFPVFVILDGNGSVLHIQNSAYLEEGKGHSVKKVMEFLQGWTAAAIKPENNK
ncbi:thioredoxin family protein [Pedobacter nyackensis]|uniref:thioredoxin family protein n=1 Tax=Pedobacter nyackensis TaxID=475255 RepID=UPI00292D027F|nr:thioredoxin family protein [Pedobacter nyackensis]